MGNIIYNGVEATIDKEKLDKILESKFWTYQELHTRMEIKYDLKLKYKGFINALTGQTKYWKLTYAMAICGVLNVGVEELFILEKRDTEEIEE